MCQRWDSSREGAPARRTRSFFLLAVFAPDATRNGNTKLATGGLRDGKPPAAVRQRMPPGTSRYREDIRRSPTTSGCSAEYECPQPECVVASPGPPRTSPAKNPGGPGRSQDAPVRGSHVKTTRWPPKGCPMPSHKFQVETVYVIGAISRNVPGGPTK
jgi:hypothetical protein